MMARLEYFIVCESTSVDAETNRISLFHVLEDVFPEIIPGVLPRIEAVSLWNLEAEDAVRDFQVALRINLPGVAVGPTFEMNLTRGRRRYRAALAIENIPLERVGPLLFEVLLNGNHIAGHTVTIHEMGALRPGVDLHGDPFAEPPRPEPGE